MSRSGRLLALVEVLRRHRRPVSGAALAAETGVSLRTLYRDVATLRGEGAPVEGSAGLGYVLAPGWLLPPLRFDADERDALALGLRMVMRRGDPALRRAASGALAKIEAVAPAEERAAWQGGAAVVAGPGREAAPALATIRAAMRDERKLRLRYRDKSAADSERVVWPLAVGFFDAAEILAAWCETRADFRHFRLDRIVDATALPARLPRRRAILVAEWRAAQGLTDADEN